MLAPFLRKTFNSCSKYLTPIIIRANPVPNHITLLSIPLSFFASLAIIKRYYLLAAILIALFSILDNLDGLVAKVLLKKSLLGDYLDSMADRYREIIFYLGFALGGYPLESSLAISGALLISFSKARTAMCISMDDHDWPAIGDMADRLTIIIFGLILAQIKPNILNHSTVSITLLILFIVAHIGAIQRIFYAKRLISKATVGEKSTTLGNNP